MAWMVMLVYLCIIYKYQRQFGFLDFCNDCQEQGSKKVSREIQVIFLAGKKDELVLKSTWGCMTRLCAFHSKNGDRSKQAKRRFSV